MRHSRRFALSTIILLLACAVTQAQQASYPNMVKGVTVAGTCVSIDSFTSNQNVWNVYCVWVQDAAGNFWQVWTNNLPAATPGQQVSYVGDGPYGQPAAWGRFVINSK